MCLSTFPLFAPFICTCVIPLSPPYFLPLGPTRLCQLLHQPLINMVHMLPCSNNKPIPPPGTQICKLLINRLAQATRSGTAVINTLMMPPLVLACNRPMIIVQISIFLRLYSLFNAHRPQSGFIVSHPFLIFSRTTSRPRGGSSSHSRRIIYPCRVTARVRVAGMCLETLRSGSWRNIGTDIGGVYRITPTVFFIF